MLEPISPRGRISARSVVLGVCGVVVIAGYALYNDFKLDNTYFIGSHFPIGVTLMMFILILGINPCLGPRRLRSAELLLIWSMWLVACAFPAGGLLGRLIPWMVTPFYLLPQHPEWESVVTMLPDWLFPTTDPANDHVVTRFFLGTAEGEPVHVPWKAWIGPLMGWGMYYVPLFIGTLLISVLLTRQWVVHEKLQYPLATVMLAMTADPPPGRRLNALFRDPRMWLGAGIVMFVHLLTGLHNYYPEVPMFPRGFNLQPLFTEGVWAHFEWYMRTQTIYYSMIGIAFLMSAEVSGSLWFFMVFYGIIMAIMRYHGVDPWESMRSQNYGAMLAMGLYLLFIARAHLGRAFRVALGGRGNAGDRDYIVYRPIVWGLIICVLSCIAWLCATGMSLWVAVVQLIIVYLVYLVLARLVCETGLFIVMQRMWSDHLFPLLLPGVISAKNQALVISNVWPLFYTRETLMPFAFTAMRLAHETQKHVRRSIVSRRFVSLLIAAMLISLVVATLASIALYYKEGAVRTNEWMALTWATYKLQYMRDYQDGLPSLPGQGPVHMAIGAAIVVALGTCRMRFSKWPLVPIAFCMATSDALGYMWFSIFIGWSCKLVSMRLGGVAAYNRLRPVFLGLVIGEVFMAGIWMVVGAIVRMRGHELNSVGLFPG